LRTSSSKTSCLDSKLTVAVVLLAAHRVGTYGTKVVACQISFISLYHFLRINFSTPVADGRYDGAAPTRANGPGPLATRTDHNGASDRHESYHKD